jgi:ribosomal protein S18 acetylase RimI-like enzyme
MKVDIQEIAINEVVPLQEIGIQTFQKHFSHNSAENMAKYLQNGFALEKLKEELTNPDSKFYFARKEGRIGYLKLNFGASQTELKDSSSLEIERIYVLKDFHGKNVGQLLYDKAIEVATQMKVNYVWLGVWEENKRALSFIQRMAL